MSAPPPPAGPDAVPSETLSYGRQPSPDAAPEDERGAGLPRGSRVHRYTILDRVGEGGMGVVYAAYDPSLDRRVALKFLVPQDPARQSVREARLVREAQAMARLSHPNVAVVYEVGTFEGSVFLAMEFVDGVDLRAWLREENRSLAQILEVFLSAGRGLAAAHAAGIVHRDFKPENVLLDDADRPRVTDFGLARSSQDGERTISEEEGDDVTLRPASPLAASLTRTGGLLGTPSYMAPEQHRGAEADARADQFAFCVALYEGLYGVRPFAGANPAEIAAAIEARRIEAPGASGKVVPRAPGLDVPRWLRAIVVRGLEPRAEDRWPSMEALLAALGRDPRGAPRRWMVGGGVVAGLVVAAALLVRGEAVEACPSARDRVAGIWDAGARAKVRAAFLATGSPIAADVFARVERALDGRLNSWVAAHREACVATKVRGEQSEALLDLRMQCLERARRQIAALADVWQDDVKVEKAVGAALGVGDLDTCADTESLAKPIPPPSDPQAKARVENVQTQLDQVSALQHAGQFVSALTLVREAARAARALGYPPTLAEALHRNGWLEFEAGKREIGIQLLHDAFKAANEAHEDVRAATVARVLLHQVVWTDRQIEQRDLLWRMAEAAAARASSRPEVSALLLMTQGLILSAEGKFDDGVRHLRRALEMQEQLPPGDDFEVADTLVNLGISLSMAGKLEEAIAVNKRAGRVYEQALGPVHPRVAVGLEILALTQSESGHHDAAIASSTQALAITTRLYPPDHLKQFIGLTNLARVKLEAREEDEARALYARIISARERLFRPDHLQLANSRLNLAQLLVRYRETAEARRLLDLAAPVFLKTWPSSHPSRANVDRIQGQILILEGRLAAARRAFESAERVFREAGSFPADIAVIRSGLADVALAEHRPDEAIEHLRAAREALNQKPLKANDFHIIPILTGLGRAHLAGGHRAEGLRYLEDAIARADANGRPSRFDGAQARFALARALWTRKSPGRATELARAAREVLSGRKDAVEIDTWLRSHHAP